MVKALVASIVVCRCSPSCLVRSVAESNAQGAALPIRTWPALVRRSADAKRAPVRGDIDGYLALIEQSKDYTITLEQAAALA